VGEFIDELEVSAQMEAEGHGVNLAVSPVSADIVVDVDRQLLASAVSNLLQNAFKFTKPEGTVSLVTQATKDRVSIEVSDECGGLPAGKEEELFRPFTRGSSDRSGLGLGLSIALSATRANSGELYVRNIPGKGCVFTIDLPRQPASPSPLFRVLPDGEHGPFEGADPAIEGRAHLREPRSGAG
jgi:signal transduction histidine kinase